LIDSGRVGMVIAFLFLLCGALRLARFNANIAKVKSDYFQGLPIPGAALAVLSYILVSLDFDVFNNLYVAIPYIIFYALLMISNLPFPSFKNSDWVRKNKRKVLFLVFLIISSLFIYEQVMIPVIISLYVLLSLGYTALHRDKLQGVFDWEDSDGEASEAR